MRNHYCMLKKQVNYIDVGDYTLTSATVDPPGPNVARMQLNSCLKHLCA